MRHVHKAHRYLRNGNDEHNNQMQRTRHSKDGASPLIWGLGSTDKHGRGRHNDFR